MSMPDTEPTIRVTAPGDLVEMVPYLLGFHPTDSLVLIGFTAGTHQVQVAMRVDLPAAEAAATELLPLVHPLQRAQVDEVIAVLFTNDPQGRPLRPVADALTATLEQFHIRVLDLLIATDSHWWSMLCADIGCCPVGGTPRVKDSMVAAKATYAGLVAAPARADREKVFEGEPDPERYQPALEAAELRFTQALMDDRLARTRSGDTALCKAEARRHVDDHTRRLTTAQLARIAVALTDIQVRDELWLAIDDGSLDADRLLIELFTRLPEPYQPAPLFLFGWAAWRRGDGVLASMALDRVHAIDPGYSAARLLDAANSQGLDPRKVPKLREGGSDDDAER